MTEAESRRGVRAFLHEPAHVREARQSLSVCPLLPAAPILRSVPTQTHRANEHPGGQVVNSQRNNLFLFFVLVLALSALAVIWPQRPTNYLPSFIPWPSSPGIHIGLFNFHREGFRLGLDLQGGTHMVLQADTARVPPGGDANAAVDGVTRVIEQRINAYGVSEPIVQRRGGDRIIVELPGVRDIEEAKNLIGKTAQMDFREKKTVDGQEQWVAAIATGSDGIEKPLTGQYFTKAEVAFEQGTNKPMILFEFNSEGAKLFGEITQRLGGGVQKQPLGIFLDDEPITTPTVQNHIPDGSGQITGSFTLDEARNLVIQLNAGALPLPVTIEEERTVDATLGSDSIRKSVVAGEVALLVVALFMILHYRMLGVVAVGALFVYTLVVLAVFKLIPVTLTLAGIAGFILSVGMAVDANILIFERMREEIRSGKTIGAAIDAGCGRAWPSIRDSNITTMLICGILYWFGSTFGASIVMGFALTLFIGVLVSMFSAVLVTRGLLLVILGRRAALNPALLGIPSGRPQLEPAGMKS
ncbi:MAG: protein translocase subunit SecD [Chloroflexi bacterium]|nr:protein translocase subunit SecD [Chloroflexota bacterium]